MDMTANRVIGGIRQMATKHNLSDSKWNKVEDCLTYFAARSEYMKYDEYLAAGYRNIRVDGRGIVEIDPENGEKIRCIYEWYAYHNMTLDDLARRLFDEGIYYTRDEAEIPNRHASLDFDQSSVHWRSRASRAVVSREA